MKKRNQLYSIYKQTFLYIIGMLLFSTLSAQNLNIILGRPTDNAVTASILFDKDVDYFIEYGTVSGSYPTKSVAYKGLAGKPDEIDITGLTASTKYFYRVNYKLITSVNYTISTEYSFHTQRLKGEEFSFTLEADEHLYDKKGVKNMYQVTLNNQAKDKPDFMMSLGDIFGDDHNPYTITSGALDSLHKDYRPFLGSICHSIPFYVCLGNHEGENDFYYTKTPPNNLSIWGTLWRKYYFPNPSPNDFYTGNTDVENYGIGNPENYYAWTWGDAQFIVLDAYRDQCDTAAMPKGWDWSLGEKQYKWLQQTLETSTSKYKFVFCHHVTGLGRGGVTNAKYFEWGGLEQNGKSYGFTKKRPGWAKPIHQLFVDNGVNIFFQGHDHLFAHEVLDGVVYQEVPMPSDSTYEIGMLANANAYISDTIGGTGHVRVTVKQSCITVDFVRAYLPKDTLDGKHKNGEIAFSYTLGNCSATGVEHLLDEKEFIKVAPVPANDKISVYFAENVSDIKLKLSNTFGEEILTTNTKDINVSAFPNGVYLLTIEANNIITTRKIIVNH